VEAGIDVIEVRETLEEQPGTYQEDERECDLPRHQHSTRTRGKMAVEPAANGGVQEIALQDGSEIAAKCGDPRRKAEEDAGE
jgi:hypothetical protein